MSPLLLLGALWLAAAVPPPAEEPFVVIVNAANAVAPLTRAEVASLFLRQASTWPTLEKAHPVDLPEGSAARRAFSQAVLRRSSAQLAAYWQEMIFAGRDVPPPKKTSDAEVIAFVARQPGAIGYVSGSAPLPNSVRRLVLRD